MKSLSPSRPLVIMLVGIPGAGKSHFARQFSDIFNAPLVSFDEIRHRLFSEPQFTRDEETIIALMMKMQITQLFKTEKTFIIDGGLNTKMARTAIERLAKGNDYGTLTIWVQIDEDTANFRSTRRSVKRTGDLYNKSMTESIFMSFTKRINPPDEREHHAVISGKHTFASQAKAVLKKIVVPRENETVAPIRTAAPVRPAKSHRGMIGS